jgi:hypothetical protein
MSWLLPIHHSKDMGYAKERKEDDEGIKSMQKTMLEK